MTSNYEFSQVRPPDLSTSATLMRNAGDSFKDAADAISLGASQIRAANINKIDRLRTNNSALFQARIDNATTLEELESLRTEITSPEFAKEYQNGLYIDPDALLNRLNKRPQEISERVEIENKLASQNTQEVTSGILQAISMARTEDEILASLAQARGKGLTIQQQKQVNDAAIQARAMLSNKALNATKLTTAQLELQAIQNREKYNISLTTLTSSAAEDMIKNPNFNTEDIAVVADKLTTKLVQETGLNPVVVRTEVEKRLNDVYGSLTAEGLSKVHAAMNEQQRSLAVAAKSQIQGYETTVGVDYDTQAKAIAKGVFPVISGSVDSPSLVGLDGELFSSEFREKIKTTKFNKLPTELRTEATVRALRQTATQADFDTRVDKIMADYAQYTAYQTAAAKIRGSYISKQKLEAARLNRQLDTQAKEMYSHQQTMQAKQRAGAPQAELDELKATHTTLVEKYDNTNRDILRLVGSNEDIANTMSFTNEGAKLVVDTVTKRINALGVTADDIQTQLQFMMENYGVTLDQVKAANPPKDSKVEPVPLDNAIPQVAKDLMATLYSKEAEQRKQETHKSRASSSRKQVYDEISALRGVR